MAGDWLKIDPDLPNKPEVVQMAAALGKTRADVVCECLLPFWRWCDASIPEEDITDEGTAAVKLSPRNGDNMTFIDGLVGVPGFAKAYAQAGWGAFRGGKIELKNFGRHNGKTAKTRARNSKNQNKKRNPVIEMSPPSGDKIVTREEKRREEESSNEDSSIYPLPPSLDTAAFRSEWDRWLEWRRAEKKKPVSASGARSQLAELAAHGATVAIEAIRTSIKCDWQGLFPAKVNQNGNHRNAPTGYDPQRPLGEI